jgi:hypothetical protein
MVFIGKCVRARLWIDDRNSHTISSIPAHAMPQSLLCILSSTLLFILVFILSRFYHSVLNIDRNCTPVLTLELFCFVWKGLIGTENWSLIGKHPTTENMRDDQRNQYTLAQLPISSYFFRLLYLGRSSGGAVTSPCYPCYLCAV